MYNADGEKEGTLRRFLCNEIGEATNVYSIEASMYGFATDDKENPVRPYTEEDCKLRLFGTTKRFDLICSIQI